MPIEDLTGLLWTVLLLGPLLLLQRRLHFEIQAIFLLLTRRLDLTVALFSLLFFPGVLLHELSHLVMAKLLGVRTGRISLLPRATAPGKLQMGFVETASSDWLRDSLIGAAPLLAGGAFVAYVGLVQLRLPALWRQAAGLGLDGVADFLAALYQYPDFFLWFYLLITVSSTMLPSPSDRRAWLPLALLATVLLAILALAGAGPWLLEQLAAPLDRALNAVALVLGISVGVHAVLLLPTMLVRYALSRAFSLRVH